MNQSRCIFCEIESKRVVIEENGYIGKKCPQCGLIFISPRPSFDEIINLYGHDDAHISAESHISSELSKRLYARYHLRILRSVVNSGDLLEIGAGAGFFLDEARKVGFSPHGLELNPVQANYIRDRLDIPCEESPLHPSLFEGKKFDVVFHCDVISHFVDPILDFRTINEMMKDGSFLVFETGNLGEVDLRYLKYIQSFQYPDHLFFFSTDNLIKLLEKTGFKFVKMYRYSILPQLMVFKTLSGIMNSIRMFANRRCEKERHLAEAKNTDIHSVANSKSSIVKPNVIKGIKAVYQYFEYVLRYKIGRIAPKVHRPQTVIVVSRKSSQSDLSDDGELTRRST